MIQVTFKDSADRTVGLISASEKVFKTGSTGYFGNSKLLIDGDNYVCQVQLVRIGSKPKTPKE